MSSPPVGPPPPGPTPSAPDQAGPAHSPRSGAHRPRRPLWHEILPALIVLLAVAAVVIGVFALKDSVLGSGSTSSSGGPSVPGDDDNQAVAPTAPTSGASASRTATHSTTSSPPAPTVNHSQSVQVLNATSRTGLAKGAAGKLSGKGWKASSGGNQSGYAGGTTVFYAKASQKATAQAVAKDLGGYPVRLSSAYGSGVVVVLGSDYQS